MRKSWDDVFFEFEPLKRVWKPFVKKLMVGNAKRLVMKPAEVAPVRNLRTLGLYLHVPFCRNLCPFCPYNRVKYDEHLHALFEGAVHQEIDLYASKLRTVSGRKVAGSVPITSLYIGGGTPTINPTALIRILNHIRDAFGAPGDISIELHPAAMDEDCLDRLKECGVTMISVGVESLTDRLLELIGRSHSAAEAEEAVRRAVSRGFDSVNVDLMFALPTETLEDLGSDLRRVLSLGIDQVSTYPIFGFPYTELGKRLGIKAIHRPRGDLIRKMLELISETARQSGLRQCAVWSFLREKKKKFSSITRHHTIGFGPSAASMTGRQFFVNTFSVDEYIRCLPEHFPVALSLPLDRKLEQAYWFYWRAYEMFFPYDSYQELFGGRMEERFATVLSALRALGFACKTADGHQITEKAAYWIHRVQNEYSLNYIDRLWGTCQRDAWPREVCL